MNKARNQSIIHMATVAHLTIRQVAAIVNLSPAGVHKILKAAGITGRDMEIVTVNCGFCGKAIERRRCEVKAKKSSYCNREHYYASMEKGEGKFWRGNSRLVRAIVSTRFDLKPEHVVGFLDNNPANVSIENLAVFANEEESKKYARGYKTKIIWQGNIS